MQVEVPARLRLGMQTVVGVLLGSTFSKDFFAIALRFAPTIAGLVKININMLMPVNRMVVHI
jgi:uncharacterized membrane protein AbrB (regulator of aidB expression)